MARAVAPSGHVFTFEFNADRVGKAREDFARLGISPLVTVAHADACVDGFDATRLADTIDAVFLDLPRPWLAIPHAKAALRRNGVVCCFSPCIEQVMRNCAAMTEHGFQDCVTVEALGRYYEVSVGAYKAATSLGPPASASAATASATPAIGGVKRRRDDDAAGGATPVPPTAPPPCSAYPDWVWQHALGTGASWSAAGALEAPAAKRARTAGSADAVATAATDADEADVDATVAVRAASSGSVARERELITARPMAAARGHTGFLTFAHLYRKVATAAAVVTMSSGAAGGGDGGATTSAGDSVTDGATA